MLQVDLSQVKLDVTSIITRNAIQTSVRVPLAVSRARSPLLFQLVPAEQGCLRDAHPTTNKFRRRSDVRSGIGYLEVLEAPERISQR
jgi:hypothetical protein